MASEQDTIRILALGLCFGLLGYYFGRIAQARASEEAQLRARVWDLERDKREREYAKAVAEGRVPGPPAGLGGAVA